MCEEIDRKAQTNRLPSSSNRYRTNILCHIGGDTLKACRIIEGRLECEKSGCGDKVQQMETTGNANDVIVAVIKCCASKFANMKNAYHKLCYELVAKPAIIPL